MSNNWFLFILEMFGGQTIDTIIYGQTIIVLEPDIFQNLNGFC